MSLIYWLPFNGNINNQGTKSITYSATTNTSTFEAGKIGQCLTLSSTNLRLPLNYDTSKGLTIAFWFKKTSTAGAWSDFITLGSTVKDRLEITATGTGGNVYWYAGSQGIYKTSQNLGAITADTWYHFAMVVGKTESYVYINGVKNSAIGTPSHYTIDTCVIGNRIGGNYMSGAMNDFRFYDSALSDAEIKEIAQGLVLHYPMCKVDGDIIGKNILSGSERYTKTNSIKSTPTGNDSYTYYTNVYATVTEGKTYTYQCVTDGNWTTHGTVGNKNCTIWLRHYNSSGTVVGHTYFGNNGGTGGTTGRRYWQWTCPSGVVKVDIRVNTYGNGNSQVQFWNFKLEEGSIATTWTPYGISTTTIADNSGHGNRGTPTNIIGSSDCAIGSGSYYLSGGANISTGYNIFPSDMTEFTISCWAKVTGTSGYRSLVMGWHAVASDWQPIHLAVNSSNKWVFNIEDSSGNKTTGSCAANFTVNEWTHVVAVYKTGNISLYINGALAKSFNTTIVPNFANIQTLQIGTNGGGENMTGYVNDLHIFATALDANAIKQLYEARFRFYPDGSMSATDYVEGSATQQFCNTGVMNALEIKETPTADTIVEDDGAVFVKIFHHNNKSGSKLFSSSDVFTNWLYKDEDRWAALHLLNGDWVGDEYEMLIIQYPEQTSTTPQRFRFVQKVNPMTATFADVDRADITPTTLSGYTAIGSSYGGLYLKKSSTYLCANNANSGNWWGAIGAWTAHGGGIPGYNGQVVKGLTEVYVRVYNGDILRLHNNGAICAKHFKEI